MLTQKSESHIAADFTTPWCWSIEGFKLGNKDNEKVKLVEREDQVRNSCTRGQC